MAITLNARTERILDSVLRALNADEAVLRLDAPPKRIGVQGTLVVTTGGGETEITVSNGHLWPRNGNVFIYDGASSENLGYEFVRTTNGFKAPSWNGTGNPPNAILRLATGVTVVNAHTAGVFVSIDDPLVARTPSATAFDAGTVGVHDLGGLLRAIKEDLTPLVLTVSGAGNVGGTTVPANVLVASAHIGDTITMITGAGVAGETRTVVSNDATTYTVAPAFPAQVPALATYQLNTTFYDNFLAVFDANIPAGTTSIGVRAAADVGRSPSEIATTMANAIVRIITQYGGTMPTSESALNMFAREIDKTTYLVEPAGAGDTVITVADASRLPQVGDIIVGGVTVATIARNNARKGGQGPNTVTLTAALGVGYSASAVVGPSPRGTVGTGRRHTAPAPHAFGVGMVEYITSMVAAIEAYTVPS